MGERSTSLSIACGEKLRRLGDTERVSSDFVDYPSHPVTTLVDWRHPLTKYLDGVDEGISTLEDMLFARDRRCQNQRFVLFGYSQGALVVDRVLVLLSHSHPALAKRIVGVGLIADPQRLGTGAYTFGDAKAKFNGISRTLAGYPGDDIPASLQPRTVSYCSDGDMVCAFDTGLLLELGYGWTNAVLNTTKVHTTYWKAASLTVGQKVARRVKTP